ncbi:MAG TPA: peptidoglycan DD-metalloendopeptidase family protein [Vicinamibacteria bacterium]|nr:peptidoglycan DD-metalloendopeptidase family protein [Vicinamibacteria bacterium]
MTTLRLRTLSALGAFTLVLLPSHVPRWLDTASPVGSEPLTVVRGTIARNETLASALQDWLSAAALHRLVEAARPVHDLARLSVGRPFGLAIDPDGLLAAFTYGIDEVRTVRVFRRGEALEAELVTRPVETRVARVSGVIESSLFATVTGAGEEDQLALDLADIFAWDVDFNTEIQPGDHFRVAVEKLLVGGRFSRYGRILAAEFVQGTRVLQAVRFDGASSSGYFDPAGTPLRKAFLRSPLRFSRISSRFSRARRHPVLNVTRPHYGVDYAAPAGTPVVAAAAGVVKLAGWRAGYGKTVQLRHPNGFETLYGHLSKVEVVRGQRVSQGQRLGAVGRTGLATGPHLDYRMLRNGAFVDPLKVQLPPAEPLAAAERPAFESARAERLALLPPPAQPAGPTTASGP